MKVEDLLSYNKAYNFIEGKRYVGKTYSTIKFLIEKALVKRQGFVYVVRQKQEKTDNIFRNICEAIFFNYFELEDVCLSKNFLKVQHNIIGRRVSLVDEIKIGGYPDVEYILFDDYKSYFYNDLKEPDVLLSIYDKIDYGRKFVKLICLGTNQKIKNPYYDHKEFDIPNANPNEIGLSKNTLFINLEGELLR